MLFYLIVLYGCVCQPLINGYDDDDDDDEPESLHTVDAAHSVWTEIETFSIHFSWL